MMGVSPGGWQNLPARARELFGIELRESELSAFAAYLELIERWGRRMNLVGEATRDEVTDRHLLDSLALHRWTSSARLAVDVGSGAGFPALPLAVLSPGVRFQLVEARTKRVSFLRQVIRSLTLKNVDVIAARSNEWTPDSDVELMTTRAVAIGDVAGFARRVLRTDGALTLMRKAEAPALEIDGFSMTDRLEYALPDGKRHLAIKLIRSI